LIDSATSPTLAGGDFPSQVVEVKGTTYVEVSVPYMWYTAWRKTNIVNPTAGGYVENLFPLIKLEMLTKPVGLGGSPQIDVIIWRSGGEDMQFQGVVQNSLFPAILVESQSSMVEKFSKPFKPLSCECTFSAESGYTSTEPTGRIVDVLRRFYLTGSSRFEFFTPDTTGADHEIQLPLYTYANCFRYQRGSVRYRCQVLTTTGFPLITLNVIGGIIPDICRGVVPARVAGDYFQVEVPYYQTLPYFEASQTSFSYPEVMQTFPVIRDAVVSGIMTAAGDDFYMFYLRKPLPCLPPDTKKKEEKTEGVVSKQITRDLIQKV
jgi:hypothetical protein